MIDKVLDFTCAQLNAYLQSKLSLHSTDIAIIVSNVSQLNETKPNSGGDDQDPQNAFVSLINIEEDRISKSPENFVRALDGSVVYKNPKIFLNLYILFSVNLPSYSESLKRLSYIIQFFQYQNVFTSLTSPSIPDGVDELVFDLMTLSYQDLNNLWGILGSRYLPSVMYKMRMISINENFAYGGAGIIQKIGINDKALQQ
jgi:Pvc16 N-terminal domain